MKSTGEVMGGSDNFGAAFGKAMMGAGQKLPEKGCVFISVNNSDKPTVLPIARDLASSRIHARGHAWHGRLPASARPRSRGHVQGERGPAERRRSPREPHHRHGDQHAARSRVVLRRSRGSSRGHDDAGAVHHDAHRRLGCRQRDQGAASADAERALAAGLLRRRSSQSSRRRSHEDHEGHEDGNCQCPNRFATGTTISEAGLLGVVFFVAFVTSFVAFVRRAQSFRSRIDIVQVTVAVTDAEGRLITGLTKDDFQVFEDGDRQDITQFTDARVPVSLGVLLDASDSMRGQPIVDARGACGSVRRRLTAR